MAFLNEIESNTPEQYRFKLVSETTEIVCKPEPIEWASGTLNIKRDLDSGGVFSSFQQDSLTFVSNGAQFLRNLYEAYEVNAKCTLIIYWWKSSLREYIEFPSRFDINFNFYEIVKVGKFAFGVKVKAINSEQQTKLDNRIDVNVDITKLKSIGGFDIVDYPQLKKTISYDATDIFNIGISYDDKGVYYLPRIGPGDGYTSLPLKVLSSDIPEMQNVPYVTQRNINQLGSIPSFFGPAQFDKELEIYYSLAFLVKKRHIGSYPWRPQVIETNTANGITTIVNEYPIGDGFGGMVKGYTFSGTITIDVPKGNELKLIVITGYIESIVATVNLSYLKVTQRIAASPAAVTEGFPVYEATERLCQHIMDNQFPFYSNFFGRMEVPFDEFGNGYPSESQLRFAHIQSGRNQMGLPLNYTDNPLPLNFKDLFASLKAIWNVGYMFDSSIDGKLRIRIEEYAYFFQDVQVLDLSDRITGYDIQSAVMPELIPIDIKCGFDNFEYLSINGRGEPNTTHQRTSPMNTATKWENISKLRGDTKGILTNLSNPIDLNGTVDTRNDSDVFIVKTQRNITYNWIPERGENIQIDDDSSIFKNDLLNRYFTPSRMLIRNGNRVKAGMTKVNADVLRFQVSDKASNLKTTGLTNSGNDQYTITESDDIYISSLENPIYKSMKHTITCRFDFSDLELLNANPLGYIKFSDTISGFLLSLKKKNNEDRAEITIIERYIA